MNERPTILVELGCFKPGFRASGPNQSWSRIAEALSDRFRFRIIGEADPGEVEGRWHELDGCERVALRRGAGITALSRLIRSTPAALLVCNGFFDTTMTLPTLLLKKSGRIRPPLLLAPRGEFSPGALVLKGGRKQAYLSFMRRSGLLRNVTVQATDESERDLIARQLPDNRVLVGPNVRTLAPLPIARSGPAGGPLRVAFLSRIDRKKNLHWAINLLREAKVPAQFNIFGPVSDKEYWLYCQSRMANLPPHLTIDYRGAIDPEDVLATLAGHDLFLLPTLGENFGHAIADAFLAGTPALISDATPWRGLIGATAGADLPLSQPSAWHDFLRRYSQLAPDERAAWRQGARRFAEDRLDAAAATERLACCFEQAINYG